MSLDSRIAALVTKYRAEAQKLALEGVTAPRQLVRVALNLEAQRYLAFAADLQDQLEATQTSSCEPFGVAVPVLVE